MVTSLYRSVAGIYREDITRLHRALAGLNYPAQKWQLIDCAEGKPCGRGHPESRTIQQLWALPSGGYPGLAQVLSAAAQTARGHPHRRDDEPPIG